jgi:hypothetical protein
MPLRLGKESPNNTKQSSIKYNKHNIVHPLIFAMAMGFTSWQTMRPTWDDNVLDILG